MNKKLIVKEAKRVKKEYEKQTGQTFPLEYFISQVEEKFLEEKRKQLYN
jgi:hypothetical protein